MLKRRRPPPLYPATPRAEDYGRDAAPLPVVRADDAEPERLIPQPLPPEPRSNPRNRGVLAWLRAMLTGTPR